MATESHASLRHRLPRFVRIIRARPRLFISALIGLIVIALAPGGWWLPTRLLVGWDIGVALYLAAAFQLISTGDEKRMRRWAALEDEGRFGILILTVAAALASLGAIVALLERTHGNARDTLQLSLATVTILLSWAMIHTMFALHYAHEYYGERNGHAKGLIFPGDEPPDYWDFVYFSFVVGVAAQVADVSVASKTIRRTVAAHGIVSFLFNAALLALMVNIAASAI
jgi:uncharacterized membrane protein